MVEFLAFLLGIWCIYFFATGKFKKEYQDQQKIKFKRDFEKIKQDFLNISNKDKYVEAEKEINSLRKLSPCNQDYRIHYEDFKRDFSVRMISINRLYKENGHWYIDAYCHNACDERTFRVDRIQSLTIEKKNITLFDTVEILDFLKKYF